MALRALVLGAGAGGGLPQWNCSAPNSARFWRTSAAPPQATQSSLAVTADAASDAAWTVINASPDIRAQIMARPQLQPRDPQTYGLRDTPIANVVLTNGDIDHIGGLLTLREKQRFTLWATAEIHEILAANPIFNALDPALVIRRALALEATATIAPGLRLRLFAVPGKAPLFLEESEAVETDRMGEQTVGVELIGADGARAYYIPGCAALTQTLAQRLDGAPLLFFDGTVFHDDEMIREGVGQKTGRRMGHMAMAGPDGSLAAFRALKIARKIYVHINNTNPVWRPDSPERAAVEAAGWEIASDGLEARL